MFKTNSRKGLSLAAIVALASSLFVASPALAAGEVNIAPTSGTTYAAVAGQTFNVSVNVGATIPASSFGDLKVKITNTGGTTYSATISPSAGVAGTGSVTNTTSGTTLGITQGASPTDSRAVVAFQTNTSVSDAVLTVQVWLDSNRDGVVDGNEFKSDAVVLTFFKESAITWSTAFTPVVAAATNQTLSAIVSSTQGINVNQLPAGFVKVGFSTVSGTVYTAIGAASHSAGVFNNGESASPVVATNTLRALETDNTIQLGTTYAAATVVNGVEVGTKQFSVVSAERVTAIEAFTLSAGVNAVKATGTVRTGATAIELTAQISKSGVAVAAGTVVKVTITEGTLTSKSSVVAGGKTLSNLSTTTSEKIEYDATVGAAGKLTLPIALSGLVDGQSFSVNISADSQTSTVTLTVADTAFANLVNLTTNTNEEIRVASGTSVPLSFSALDNFGQPLSGDFRVILTDSRSTATVSAAVTSGLVTFNVAPTATTVYTAKAQELNVSTLAWSDATALGSGDNTRTQTVTVGAVLAPASITLTANSSSFLALNNSALKAVDTRTGATAPTLTSGNSASLTVQVNNASGVATTGMVKFSAPGVMFEYNGVYTLGEIDVRTTATGGISGVKVFSNTAGKVSVSASIGAVTKDIALTFVPAAETSGVRWVITSPATALPGSTAQFKAQLFDTWSNPVQVTSTDRIALTYTGPGFVTASLPDTTDKDGMLSFSVLFGSADTGTATVKFSYDGDGVATTTADNFATSVTTTIGAAAAASDQKLTVGSFKGFVAIYALNYTGQKLSAKVAGKWLVENNLSRFERVVRLTGAAIPIVVDLYIDGKFVRTENIVTK
jgi:hypothetical protein